MRHHRSSGGKLYSLMLKQDDPRKCTSVKLSKFGIVKAIYTSRQIPKSAILLDPGAEVIFSKLDAGFLNEGLVAVDCSWKRITEAFSRVYPGQHRRLPLLLAANPINYGHISILSSAEALAAALYIGGLEDRAELVLSKFKWGPTFLTLNHDPLEDYSRAASGKEILELEHAYFPRASFKGY